jgi:hypothetical protein
MVEMLNLVEEKKSSCCASPEEQIAQFTSVKPTEKTKCCEN